MNLHAAFFARQAQIPWWNQDAIQSKHVLILGVGGIGSHVAVACGRLGVGQVTLVDYDRVEASNLNRQVLYMPSDVGKEKAAAALNALQFHSLGTDVHAHNFDIFEQWQDTCSFILQADFVINSLDLPEVKRLLVASACVGLAKPMIYAGTDVVHGTAGMVLFQPPGGQPCYECLQATRFSVKSEEWVQLAPAHVLQEESVNYEDLVAEHVEFPNAATNIVIAGAVSNVAAMEMVKYFHGMPVANRIILDLFNFTLESFVLEGDAECIVCGQGQEVESKK
ncbi:MAG TPA: ThiF family adenylyltransferase [Candidatus Lokiarchaeia archaeon]|nr:ThiF family adenylyltransferase [Candidatus Lokiarchaeia archaeon]